MCLILKDFILKGFILQFDVSISWEGKNLKSGQKQ